MNAHRRYRMDERRSAMEATRDRIVRATYDLHNEKGVIETTFSDVAARAGVAPATVTRHFPTAGDLVAACGGHVWEQLAPPDPAAVFAGVDAPAARLRRLAEELSGIYRRGQRQIEGARQASASIPQLARFGERLDAAVEGLVRAALAPLAPPEASIRLALAVADYGVWAALHRRRLDATEALLTLLTATCPPPRS